MTRRLGERVSTAHGQGLIVAFGRPRPGWEGVWQCDVIDPTLGPIRMVDVRGPFVAVLVGDRILGFLYDDTGNRPQSGLEIVPPAVWAYIRKALGKETL